MIDYNQYIYISTVTVNPFLLHELRKQCPEFVLFGIKKTWDPATGLAGATGPVTWTLVAQVPAGAGHLYAFGSWDSMGIGGGRCSKKRCHLGWSDQS